MSWSFISPSVKDLGQVVILAFLLFSLSCDTVENETFVAEDVTGLKIAFLSRRIDGSADWLLYVMNSDGSDQELVTDVSLRYQHISISPNAQNIAFVQSTESSDELYIVNLLTKQLRLIAEHPRFCRSPVWSPLGDKIAFVRSRDETSSERDFHEIHVIDVEGGSEIVLKVSGSSSNPSWSPDGRAIAFSVEGRDLVSDSVDNGIYTASADGSNIYQIVGYGRSPEWSPNGEKIAFTSTKTGNTQIYVMNPDGTEVRQLTDSIGPGGSTGYPPPGNHSPAWSPDSRMIAYVSYPEDNPDIFSMRADGSKKKRLTNPTLRDESPAWSPLGDYILFSSNRNLDMDAEIYIMHHDGSEQRPLTYYSREDVLPVWLHAQ